MKLFGKKKPKLPEFYVVVDWNDKCREVCSGGEMNLRLYYYSNGERVGEPELFSPGKVKQFREMGIPVVFKAKTGIPIECIKAPEQYILFGRIRW